MIISKLFKKYIKKDVCVYLNVFMKIINDNNSYKSYASVLAFGPGSSNKISDLELII